MSPKLITWIILITIAKYSHQTCSSTVAITTCTWDTLKANKPLNIKEYKSYLSFSRGNLETVPSGSFKFLPQVTILQLSYNKIKNLEEDAFLGLQDLKELNLYDNQLGSIDKGVFKNCKQLEKLNLGLNKISTIHDKAFDELANLKVLNLGFNSLKAVPSAINSVPKLITLNLNNNLIDNLKSNGLSALGKLEKLFVNDNKITRIDIHALNGLRSLKEFDVRSNYLTDLNVEDLFNDANSLKSVFISINNFKCDDLTRIVGQFKRKNVQVAAGVSRSPNNVNGITCKKV